MVVNLTERQKVAAPGEAASPSHLGGRSCFSLSITITSFVLLTAALLLRFPPEQYAFLYPQCPIHHYLGILCPGCGTTRALAALLRGHIREALGLNALTTLSLPFLAAWALFLRKPFRSPRIFVPVLYTVFGIATVFTIARNL
jgi:hypothetical protein